MYDKLPFDNPQIVSSHSEGILRRLKGEHREALEKWLASLTEASDPPSSNSSEGKHCEDGSGLTPKPGAWLTAASAGLLAASLALPAPPQGEPKSLDSLLTKHSRFLQFQDGALRGPGLGFLLAEAASAQFVALGEEHNTLEIPQFTTALFRILQSKYGFQYLALEQDPIAGRLVSRPPHRGSRESVGRLSNRYLLGFTFIADQELQMLAEVSGASRGAGNPIWGCDQAFGVTHILDQLLLKVSDREAREFLTQLRDAAQARERVRDLEKDHYMGQESKSEQFARLRVLIRPAKNTELDLLVQSLILSDRIYCHYREDRGYQNGLEREEYMKGRFLDEYRRAEKVDKKAPRVLLKFGHWHLFRGLGPSNVQTLGNLVSEFAKANGHDAFHLAIFPNGRSGEYGDLAKWADPVPRWFARQAKVTEWTLLDLRPLRPFFGRIAKELPADRKDSLRRWLFGFDAALFVGGMHRASSELNPGVSY